MTESPRRHARELVLQALYACEYGDGKPEESLKKLLEADALNESNTLFARKLYRSVLAKTEWADGQIVRLATNWDIRRIAAIDRVILRMALVELAEGEYVPVKVVLNEAIELAKKYSTGESSGFVNGILDTFVKEAGQTEGL
jgi:N utilization substance protein B